MATRRPPRKTTARGTRREPSKPAERSAGEPPNLLSAGLSALREAHGRHSRLFESLLGVDASAERRTLFKLPTFEDLFDERVARTLERIGVVQALAEQRERLDAFDERLKALEGGITAPPAAPARPRAAAKRAKKA